MNLITDDIRDNNLQTSKRFNNSARTLSVNTPLFLYKTAWSRLAISLVLSSPIGHQGKPV